MLLLRMLAGSRLYGTAHAGSDYDWYEIVDQGKPFHRAHDPEYGDITRWPLSMLMRIAEKGGHNALDVMFAPRGWPEVDLLADLRESYVANPWACWPRFHKTIKSVLNRGDAKGELHAQRLADNLESIMRTGRYNPVWIRREDA